MQTKPPPTRTNRLGDTTVLNPDGTTGYPTIGVTYLDTGTAVVDAPTSIGVEMAAKLAVVECLINLVAYDVDGPRAAEAADLGETLSPAPRIELRADSIFIDWPEGGSEHAPLKVTVRDGDEGYAYEPLGLSGSDYIDDTEDKFGKGTVLMHEHDVTGTVIIEATLASSSVRNAVKLALSRIFGVEPHDFRTGRRIALKAYYDTDVRITLARVPFASGDRPDDVQSNEYPLFCFLDVELGNLRLVKSPGRYEPAIDASDMPRE